MEDVIDEVGPDLSPAEAAIAADLRAAFLVEPDADVTERHVAAMVAARRAHLAPPVASLVGYRTRKAVMAAGLAGAVVLGSAGVAAAAGGLPDPLQRAAASIVRPVGIHLPEPAEHRRESPGEPATTVPESTTQPGVTSTAVAPVPSTGGDPSQPGAGNDNSGGDQNRRDPQPPPTTQPQSNPGDGHKSDSGGDQNHDGGGGSRGPGGGGGGGGGNPGPGGDGQGGGGR